MHSNGVNDSSQHFGQSLSLVFACVLRLRCKCSQELPVHLNSGVIDDLSHFELALFLDKLFALTIRGKLFHSKLARGKRKSIINCSVVVLLSMSSRSFSI